MRLALEPNVPSPYERDATENRNVRASNVHSKLLRCAIYTRKSSEEGLEQDFNSLHA